MDRCRLPVEVCERIIDAVVPSIPHTPFQYPLYLGDLCTCALTCQDWLARSRRNLYRRVRVRVPEQLESLSETILRHPFLADLVHELIVGSATEEQSFKGYLPFAGEVLVRALRNVRILTLSHFRWETLPHTYPAIAARYPVVELNIVEGRFNTFLDVAHVVWAFPRLRTLRLVDNTLKSSSLVNMDNIVKRRVKMCHTLENVFMSGDSRQPLVHSSFPPPGFFGMNVTVLTLTWSKDLQVNAGLPYESVVEVPSLTHWREYATSLSSHLCSLPCLQHVVWRFTEDLAALRLLAAFKEYVSFVLTKALRDKKGTRVKVVSLRFEPARRGLATVTRVSFLDTLLLSFLKTLQSDDTDWNELATQGQLQHLELIVPEPVSSEHDEIWWTEQLLARFRTPRWLVHVETYEIESVVMWLSDWTIPQREYVSDRPKSKQLPRKRQGKFACRFAFVDSYHGEVLRNHGPRYFLEHRYHNRGFLPAAAAFVLFGKPLGDVSERTRISRNPETLVGQVAEELHSFMQECSITFRGRVVPFNHLEIVDLRRPSPAVVQPTLGILPEFRQLYTGDYETDAIDMLSSILVTIKRT